MANNDIQVQRVFLSFTEKVAYWKLSATLVKKIYKDYSYAGPGIRPITQNGGPMSGLFPPPPPHGHPNFMNLRPPNMPPNMPQRLFHQHPSR